jgi:hypothetical protein
VGPLLGLDMLNAGVLYADLFTQQLDLLLRTVYLGPSAEPSVHAVGGTPPGCGVGAFLSNERWGLDAL